MDFFDIVYTASATWVHLVGCPQNSFQCQLLLKSFRKI